MDESDELRRAPPAPPALGAAQAAFEDAHHLWHAAADAYHDPEPFRRHTEACIQALRNVTWRLQAAKTDLPGDFDAWYGQWRA
ncbi:MAG TPA: hypothetical protein VFC99_20495, partial [Acidimicrobiia bacterium]|nr:hypothetical protein [Acidimicrobiia bacterium]